MWKKLTFQNSQWSMATNRRNSRETQYLKTFLCSTKSLLATRNSQRSSYLPSFSCYYAKKRKNWWRSQTAFEICETWIYRRKIRRFRLSQWMEGRFIRRRETTYRNGKTLLPQANFRYPGWVHKCGQYGFLSLAVYKSKVAGHNSVHSDPQKQFIQIPWLQDLPRWWWKLLSGEDSSLMLYNLIGCNYYW